MHWQVPRPVRPGMKKQREDRMKITGGRGSIPTSPTKPQTLRKSEPLLRRVFSLLCNTRKDGKHPLAYPPLGKVGKLTHQDFDP